MASPNAIATISTGKFASTTPTASNPNSPARNPCWKTRVIAPNAADSDSRFIAIDLSGSSTDPKARNSTR